MEQIIQKLREAELEFARGQTVPQVAKKIGVTEQTYYRWRKEYGGLRTDQAKRFKELEQENARLKRLLADAELDKAILARGRLGKLLSPTVGVGPSAHVRETLDRVSERRACRVLGQARATQRRPAPRSRRRTAIGRADHGVGERLRSLRLSPDYGLITSRRLERES